LKEFQYFEPKLPPMKVLLSCVLVATIALFAFDNDRKQEYEMKKYWLVFLMKGPNRNQDSATAARIQTAHLNNIDRLHKEGKIIMAGPMGYPKGQSRDLSGIFIMDAKDSTEAASYVATDSAIITGRLRFELHPWWTAKGTYLFK
jgi:uncharacterized protein YciI